MPGHLFITRGNLLHLACDAILIPSGTDADGNRGDIADHWQPLRVSMVHGRAVDHPTGTDAVALAYRGNKEDCAVWLGHTGSDELQPGDILKVVEQFVRRAAAAGPVVKARPLGDQRRPLLGLPLVGTGLGRQRPGEVVKGVVERIEKTLKTKVDADVVLVLFDDESYAAAQQARSLESFDNERDIETRDRIIDLADRALEGELVLFIGAGVSIGAGLPSWRGLLSELLRKHVRPNSILRKQLKRQDNRDIAAFIEKDLTREVLTKLIADRFSQQRCSIVHQLLASLPVREAVTTNYDKLYEQAGADAGAPVKVLPRDRPDRGKWLLKLHGSVDDPGRIVLSRSDYMRLEGTSSALAGVVQTMLLTKHLLFVGYSLSDENFHRIVHQVRDVTRDAEAVGANLGTVLTPDRLTPLEALWNPEIEFVSTADDSEERNVRRFAILLDELAARTAPVAAHLRNADYGAVFNQEELAVRNAVNKLLAAADSDGVREVLRQAIHKALTPFDGGG